MGWTEQYDIPSPEIMYTSFKILLILKASPVHMCRKIIWGGGVNSIIMHTLYFSTVNRQWLGIKQAGCIRDVTDYVNGVVWGYSGFSLLGGGEAFPSQITELPPKKFEDCHSTN